MSGDQRRLLAEEDEDEHDALDRLSDTEGDSPDVRSKMPNFDARLAISFTILGAGMLWPFNSFITASEFFGAMFKDNRRISNLYSPAITSVFTVTNLLSNIYYTQNVRKANLNARIATSTVTTTIVFVVLAILTSAKLGSTQYFSFLMIIVAISGTATGALQNGVFATVGNYSPQCVQFVMIGQAIAGVTPAILSIAVALLGGEPHTAAWKRAFAYFLSSSLVLASAYFSHLYLRSRADAPDVGTASLAEEVQVSRYSRFLKRYHPWTIFLIFAMTLAIFPSVTASVLSVLPTEEGIPFKDLPRLLQPAVFIPLGFLLWNGGDLLGRCLSAVPAFASEHPRVLFLASIARFAWIPFVFLFNVRGGGAIIKSDLAFFAFMLLFGVTNGYLGSLVMSASIKQASADEKRDIGAFMSFMLCSGLVAGSLLSFAF